MYQEGRLFHHKTRKWFVFLRATEKGAFFFFKKKTFLSIVLYSALGTRLELVLLDSILLSKCDHDQKKKKSDMLHITFPSILYSNTAEYK